MGRRGPQPLPSVFRRARGGPNRAAFKTEPQPDTGAPKCPPQLSKEARKYWVGVTAVIADGVLTVDNRETLARYCHQLARWWKLAKWLDTNDDTYTVIDQQGNTRVLRHPNVITYEKLDKSLGQIEDRFGLTPSARTRVQATPPKPKAKSVEPGVPTMKIAQ